MASSAQTSERFVYFIPIPSVSRVIALTFATVFLCGFLYIPFRVGVGRSVNSMGFDPSLWLLLIGMFTLPIAFFLLLAFPPRSWLARLEFDRNCVRLVPKPFLRLIGEPTKEAALGPHPQEILLCRGTQDIAPFGFGVVVRSTDSHDRELTVETANGLCLQESETLIRGITAATGLPVRLVKREAAADGGVKELPWAPVGRFARLGSVAAILGFGAVPFIGGIAAGVSPVSGLTAVAVGVSLWLLQTLAVFLYAWRSHEKSRTAMLYWLTTAITFAALYSVVFLVTSTLIHDQ
jgi:hypothetical protein